MVQREERESESLVHVMYERLVSVGPSFVRARRMIIVRGGPPCSCCALLQTTEESNDDNEGSKRRRRRAGGTGGGMEIGGKSKWTWTWIRSWP